MEGRSIGCYNSGSITGTTGETTGGIIGTVGNATISNCYNKGTVKKAKFVGGIIGSSHPNWAAVRIINCYNKGAVSGTANVGEITGGMYNGSTSTNCYGKNQGVTAEKLGEAFKLDESQINDGFPILAWE